MENKSYTTTDHLRGLILALLSNQRPFKQIEDNLENIGKIFFDYDINKVLDKINKEGYEYFVFKLKAISCGNRSINKQMRDLADNITLLLKWEMKYGNVDNYYKSMSIKDLVKQLSYVNSPNKLKNMGKALVCEYLKYVGIDVAKPDVHLRRLFGSERLGYAINTLASEDEVFSIMDYFNEKTGMKRAYLDVLLWHYCSVGYGDICNDKPKCYKCDIRNYCNYSNK